MEQNTSLVSLGLPADATSIATVRAVVASVASRLALPYDTVDDLRIAVAEAATLLLTASPGATRLRVDLLPDDDDLCLTVWVEGATVDSDGWAGETLAWRVIDGLTDEAFESVVDDQPGIELRVRTVAR